MIAFLTLHHMDRLVLYDSSQMGTPLVVSGGKNALPKVLGWLQARTFRGQRRILFRRAPDAEAWGGSYRDRQ